MHNRSLHIAALALSAGLVLPSIAADSVKDIVDVASGSKDHTTLVTAVKAADLVTVLRGSGPLTVFAPTNAAFDKLPKGTVEGLLKPDKKFDLEKILQYHVSTSVYETKDMKDGMTLGVANGGKVTFRVKDGKVTVNDANIVATIRASNGIIHVIDGVLLPPAKQ
ncbi:MAG: fasciclin domain-containing protein [Deltaproteobacteria bacterium]|nr:fasciclin domain-containing protein [Deltaproteobacteria bacterium]